MAISVRFGNNVILMHNVDSWIGSWNEYKPFKPYSFSDPPFQGLFIFLFHVVRHEKVYGKMKSKLPNLKVCMDIRLY